MPFVLRKINKGYWQIPNWLPVGDLQANVLKDLNAKDNRLSVWLVDDDLTNLDDVAVALASNSNQVDKLDIALLKEEIVCKLGIEIEQALGKTPYTAANDWHRNLRDLSLLKCVGLAYGIFDNSCTIKRYPEKDVLRLLCRAVSTRRVQLSDLQEKVRKKVQADMVGNNAG